MNIEVMQKTGKFNDIRIYCYEYKFTLRKKLRFLNKAPKGVPFF